MAASDPHLPRLLTFSERAKFALIPKRLYAHYRAGRELRHRACEPELKLLPILVDRERTSVDVGANRGSYTYFLSRLSQHVYAYEPNPAMRAYLQGAVGRNVTVSPKALSDRSGEATLVIPMSGKRCANNTGSLETRITGPSNQVRVTVPAGRLDDENLTDVGFMKIDVEGHELSVLRGAREVIRRDRPVLLVEILPEPSDFHVEETIRFVESQGYETFVVLNSHRMVHYSMIAGTRRTAEIESGRRSHNFIFMPCARKAA